MKKKLDGINVLYPTPTVLVGAIVNGKPNYITIAHIGIVNHAKPYLIQALSDFAEHGKSSSHQSGYQGKQSFQREHPF